MSFRERLHERGRTAEKKGGGISPVILGIDPGLHLTGYGVVEVDQANHPQLREAGVIRASARGDLGMRVKTIFDGITELIDIFRPTVLALEELYSHYQRPRTAILMGHARGVICLAAAQAGIRVVHYGATQVKRILTGSGRAPKSQIQRAVQKELALPSLPNPPDVADALAIAICHAYLQRKQELLAAVKC
ncbi:MAG: crossover junction endodeoxyribonuclease RuvC [Thermogutta sp.]